MVLGAVEGYGFPLQGKCLDRFDTDGLHQRACTAADAEPTTETCGIGTNLGLKVFMDARWLVTP